jgi:hypothetical protein
MDFENDRYFPPDGYDVYLKRKAKGRGEKVSSTLGILWRAIRANVGTPRLEGPERSGHHDKDIAWTY